MQNFQNIYSLSKTLRFELKPLAINNKEELIESQEAIESFVAADEKKADAYKEVKLYLDELHREFIRKAFANFELSLEELESAYKAFANSGHNEAEKDSFEEGQKELRTKINNHLNNDDIKALFGKKVIALLKDKFQSNEEAMAIISEFDKFTTYFGGYNQSRKNMYNMNIPERLINDNLPKHYKNVKDYQKIKELLSDELDQLSRDFQISTDELFSVSYFNKTMTQSGIDKYNEIIGGRAEKEGQKTKGLNEYINEYNMRHKAEKLPKFKQLYKQILSKAESNSFRYSEIINNEELTSEIDNYYAELNQNILKTNMLPKLFKELAAGNYNLSKIYIPLSQITSVSHAAFGPWNYITLAMKDKFSTDETMKKVVELLENSAEDKSKNKKSTFISLDILRQALPPESEHDFTELMEYFVEMKVPYRKTDNNETNNKRQDLNLFENINEAYEKYLEDKDSIDNIKALLDAIKALQNFVRIFISDATVDTDAAFYNILNEQYATLRKIISLYNRARNLATKKPYSLEKFKLNFNCPTLLDGWDVNKEQANQSILFRKDGLYYLGIVDSKYKKDVFDKLKEEAISPENCYEKIEYKLLPGANKMLPKVFICSKTGIEEFHPSADLLEKYEKGCHKKGDSFDIDFCHELIDFFKSSINKHQDWSKFNFHFSPTESYEDLSGFYREIEAQGYKITFKNIAASRIHDLVKAKKLYLFKIYNKDFSKLSYGAPNLHTMYWRALFDEDNLKNVVYKLNGEAEMFFRKKSINKKFVHKKNKGIDCRRSKLKKTFPYDIIKDRRFTVDKLQFHVPITLNFKARGRDNINDLVREYIKSSDDISVIGIDRGERNLLYYSLIDSKGNLKDQGSLNVISERFSTDYHCL
ncbi:MAG: type V CRISPR-associated protein Cas12a/Cpf1, partial [Alphaproteobacteria bacterium]|nr:type V CRISPR-associated protein Cas12a/Cpf1 [Alphaproteobacteria bacterium]